MIGCGIQPFTRGTQISTSYIDWDSPSFDHGLYYLHASYQFNNQLFGSPVSWAPHHGLAAMSGMAAMWFWSLDTSLLSGFGSGACLVSFYLRVGGGIFSKGAELGPLDMGKETLEILVFSFATKNSIMICKK